LPAAIHDPLQYMESEQGGDEKNLVSDSGDDKGDGLTEKTPIRSWQRFIQLCEGNDEIIIMGTAAQGR
jgi:hypothetical protein